ncbi:MAG: SCO family protein [Owenweeksia sp.]|nr:SCO family protein [Owenweeksia sp.]
MNPTFAPMKMNRYDWLKIAILLLIFAGGLIAGYQILKPMRSLPIYNPSDLDPRLVQSGMESKSKNHHTQPFALLNQYGDSITEKNLEGKIYVADFFFTSCPGICKDMAVQKRRLQKEFENENRFVLVSHSVTPVSDSVPVMREYAELQGAIQGKWQLLTGDKPQIYRLARQSYFAVLR